MKHSIQKRVASALLSLVLLLTLLPARVFAAEIVDSGECGAEGDNLTWTLDSEGTLTISGEGKMKNYSSATTVSSGAAPWCDNRSSIKTAKLESGVTSIGEYAFARCSALKNVEIPDSVTSIDLFAFFATGLMDVPVANGVTSIHIGVFQSCKNLRDVTIPNNVRSIASSAFTNSSLTKVTISGNLTSIGVGAFSLCSALTNIDVELGNSTYKDIDGVLFSADGTVLHTYPAGRTASSYTIPNDVTEIENFAFDSCENLRSVVIPVSVEKIGSSAFNKCEDLTHVYYNGDVTQWQQISISDINNECLQNATIHYNTVASGECGAEGDNLTWTLDSEGTLTISGEGKMATWNLNAVPWFDKQSGIKTAVLESGVTSIGRYAFNGYNALTGVTIPDSVTSIGSAAFSYCTALTGVTIPVGVTSIGDEAFYGCTDLTDVTIPASVTSIGSSAFNGCNKLTAIAVDSGNSAYKDIDGVLFSADGTLLTYPAGRTVLSYTIPDGVTGIGSSAFRSCRALTSVTIPDSVTSIGSSAFNGCDKLTAITVDSGNSAYKDIDGVLFSADGTLLHAYPAGKTALSYTIPDSVTSIGSSAISYNSALTSVTIPVSVTNIMDRAFVSCTALTDVYFGGSEDEWTSAARSKEAIGLADTVTVHCGVTPLTLSAVKFVPFYQDFGGGGEDESTRFEWVGDDPTNWGLSFDPETGVLSGAPNNATEEEKPYRFKIIPVVNDLWEVGWSVTLNVADNSDAAVEEETASELNVEHKEDDTYWIVTLGDKQNLEFHITDYGGGASDFDNFLALYLDGRPLENGYRYGEGETGKETVEEVEKKGDHPYYAQSGSTKITIYAQTLKNVPNAPNKNPTYHTLAATFKKANPQPGESPIAVAAQNFEIIAPQNSEIPDPKPNSTSKSRSGSGSSGGSSTPTKPTVYYAGPIGYTVDAATAKLETLTEDALKQLKSGSGTLTIDLTGSSNKVTAAELPAGCIEQLAKLLSENGYDKLAFRLTGGAVELDVGIAAAVAAQAAGKSAVVSLTEKTADQFNDAQRKALEGKEVVKLFSVSIMAGDREMPDFVGGRVIVRVPLELSKDARSYAVWHVAEDGKLSRHSTSCAVKELTFRSAHFSDFAVIYDERKKLSDVADGMWYTADVDQIVALGIMNGTPEGRFAPDDVLTRAMFAQILFNVEQGEHGAVRVFEDVPDNEWYSDAVNWAKQAGVIDGLGNGRYEPMRGVTREELVNILYKYASYKQYDISHTATLERFLDADRLSNWARPAMEWAVGNKLINGMNGTLAAGSGATRAQAAKVLIYFLEQYESAAGC